MNKIQKLVLTVKMAVLFYSCSNPTDNYTINTNPNSVNNSVIYESNTVFGVNMIPNTSENTKVFNFGKLLFNNIDSVTIQFDYLMIENEGISYNNILFYQTINNVMLIGSL